VLRRLYEFSDWVRERGRRRVSAPDHALGRRGEDMAHRFLQRAGFIVVARNYRMSSGAGEIDLIGWDGGTLVFVEVKSRQTDEYGAPDRAIGAEKQVSVMRAAREYARHAGVAWEKVRFDVVAVVFGQPPAITHFRDVFSLGSPRGRRGVSISGAQ